LVIVTSRYAGLSSVAPRSLASRAARSGARTSASAPR
jgi:hypothetical protein